MATTEQLALLDERCPAPVGPPAARWLVGSPPPGASLVERWLDGDDEARLLAALDHEPWRTDIARRVQQHGLRYSGRRHERPRVVPGGLPGWLTPVVDRLDAEQVLERRAEQCNVNEYLPGQGIAPHVDVGHFGGVVALVSLVSPTVLCFDRLGAEGEAVERAELLLPPRSLLVLGGEARQRWRHGIAKRKSDRIDGVRVPRGRRVSLTLRTLAGDPPPSR